MSSKLRNPNKDLRALKKNDIKILKRVRTQLKVARNHFRNNREVIARLYSDVSIDINIISMMTETRVKYFKNQQIFNSDCKSLQ